MDTEITGPGGTDQPLVAQDPTNSDLIDVVFKLSAISDVNVPCSFATT
ncbi:MAG: hypothetical protein M3179_05475 [Actinomycetota bacterium]|nr:hypothetical protein [Actinomycetota bacterium]